MKHSSNSQPDRLPLVAIGVPVYNGEKYLEECLNSILSQTFTNWECIVVNNRSTDGSADIVRKFEKADARFRLVDCSEFVGLVENWNRLFPNINSGAKYFKVVQADDWIYPEAIELMVGLMEKYPSAGICTSYRIDGKEVNCDGLHYYDGPLFSGPELLKRHLKGGIDITGSVTTPIFRISVLKKLPTFPKLFNEEEYHIDTRIVYEMMHLADVAFVFRVLSYTRWHDSAETMTLAIKYNTFLNGRFHRLYRFSQLYPEFENAFREHRNKYAYFLLKEKIKGNKKLLEWHEKYLPQKFRMNDYIKAAALRNGLTYRVRSLFGHPDHHG
jgi:glycosyltransferase involved in cell wall biosynthesis